MPILSILGYWAIMLDPSNRQHTRPKTCKDSPKSNVVAYVWCPGNRLQVGYSRSTAHLSPVAVSACCAHFKCTESFMFPGLHRLHRHWQAPVGRIREHHAETHMPVKFPLVSMGHLTTVPAALSSEVCYHGDSAVWVIPASGARHSGLGSR